EKPSFIQWRVRQSRWTRSGCTLVRAFETQRFYDSRHATTSGNGQWRSSRDGQLRVLSDTGSVLHKCNPQSRAATVTDGNSVAARVILRVRPVNLSLAQHECVP